MYFLVQGCVDFYFSLPFYTLLLFIYFYMHGDLINIASKVIQKLQYR